MESLLLLIVASIVLDTIFVAFFRRQRKGKFRVTNNGENQIKIKSNFGRFIFDKKSKTLIYWENEKLKTVGFSKIEGIEINVTDDFAFLREVIFGLNIFDMFKRYQDSDFTNTLIIRTFNEGSIPIFTVGQYHQRDFLMMWYINTQTTILSSLGLLKDASERARSSQEQIQELFRKLGINNHLLKPK